MSGPVQWDESRMRRVRADVCDVATSREEVVLSFGTLVPPGVESEAAIALAGRVALNPPAARELARLLEELVREYEAQCGALPDPGAPRRG